MGHRWNMAAFLAAWIGCGGAAAWAQRGPLAPPAPAAADDFGREADSIVALCTRHAAQFADKKDGTIRSPFAAKYRTRAGVILDVRTVLDDPADLAMADPPAFPEIGPRARRYRLALGQESIIDALFGGRPREEIADRLVHKKWDLLDRATRTHALAPDEVATLSRAGGLDIKHLFDRADEALHDFGAADRDLRSALMALHEVATPIRAGFDRGPFGEGSLFAKTLAKILADRESAGVARP